MNRNISKTELNRKDMASYKTYMDGMCSRLFGNLTFNERQIKCKQWFEDTLERCFTSSQFWRGLDELWSWFFDTVTTTAHFLAVSTVFDPLDVESDPSDVSCQSIIRNVVEDYIHLVPLHHDVVQENLWLCAIVSSAATVFALKLLTAAVEYQSGKIVKCETPTVIFKSPAGELVEDHYDTVIDKLRCLFESGAQCRVTIDFGHDPPETNSETSSQGVEEVAEAPRKPAKSRSKPALTLKARSKWRI